MLLIETNFILYCRLSAIFQCFHVCFAVECPVPSCTTRLPRTKVLIHLQTHHLSVIAGGRLDNRTKIFIIFFVLSLILNLIFFWQFSQSDIQLTLLVGKFKLVVNDQKSNFDSFAQGGPFQCLKIIILSHMNFLMFRIVFQFPFSAQI